VILGPRLRLAGVITVATAAVALAGCTGAPMTPGPPTSSLPATSAATSAATPSTAGIEGAPAELATLVGRLYAGADLGTAANRDTATALGRRVAPATAVPSGAKAAIGDWFGAPIAVVSAGKDVTLAVGPTWQVVGGWWPSLGLDRPALPGQPRWVLALGSDARRGQDLARTRADTLQVIGLDGKGGGGVMGLARDLWVPLSTGGKGKVNSAMVHGGPTAQLQTVSNVTGLPIEGYAIIGFDGFTKLVDDQGGIPIVIPERVNAAHAHLVIEAGPQVLSGKEALAYARERKTLPDGDFGRSRHQGLLLVAAALKAKLAGPIAVPGALTDFAAVGRSDLSAEQMITFAAGLYQINPAQVGRGVAAGSTGWAGSQSIVVLGDQARRLFASFKDGNLS